MDISMNQPAFTLATRSGTLIDATLAAARANDCNNKLVLSHSAPANIFDARQSTAEPLAILFIIHSIHFISGFDNNTEAEAISGMKRNNAYPTARMRRSRKAAFCSFVYGLI
jgi:hypothetical protein